MENPRVIRSLIENPAYRAALFAAPMIVWTTAAQAQNQDHIVLGVGTAMTPAYQGSEEYRIMPIPAIDIKEGWFVANLRNGIGIEPINTKTVSIGASAVFVQGYRKGDIPAGVDKPSDGLGVRLFANVRTNGFVATIGAVKIISGGAEGIVADASLSYPIQVTSRFMLAPTIGTTWADRTYNDRYFGVTAAEALTSNLPAFTVGSGFKDISASLTASYRLTDRITVSATGSVSTLLGEVKGSPFVEKPTQPLGIVTLTYRFGD